MKFIEHSFVEAIQLRIMQHTDLNISSLNWHIPFCLEQERGNNIKALIQLRMQ